MFSEIVNLIFYVEIKSFVLLKYEKFIWDIMI